jgi:hypothetical protein
MDRQLGLVPVRARSHSPDTKPQPPPPQPATVDAYLLLFPPAISGVRGRLGFSQLVQFSPAQRLKVSWTGDEGANRQGFRSVKVEKQQAQQGRGETRASCRGHGHNLQELEGNARSWIPLWG